MLANDEKTEQDRAAPRKRRMPIHRSDTDRVFAGLSGGVAETLGIRSAWVRAGFVVASAAGGAGIVVYLLGWAATLNVTSGRVATPASHQKKLAIGLMFAGALLLLKQAGLWFSTEVVASVGLIAFGTASVWGRETTDTLAGRMSTSPTRARSIVGLALLVGGIAGFFGSVEALSDATPVVIAVAATAGGTLLLFGPWLWRMGDELAAERRERIRTQERAAISAHLHDSVLQTLALIQRSDDPKRMVTLARAQERELRNWLWGGPRAEPDGFRAAIEEIAVKVEDLHDLPVEVVVVGDAPLTAPLLAMAQAATEAANNAARHSGAARVSIFAEVSPSRIDVFVTDQGRGFDPSTVPADRKGLTESVVARMERHGGEVGVASTVGEGTEVHLTLPVDAPS